jgi:DNA-binding MarR family transcriptional regulator
MSVAAHYGNADDTLPITMLRRTMGDKPGLINRAGRQLYAKGLVMRGANATSQRGALLALNDAGRERLG